MLQPQEFTVEVDHKALVHLRSERSFMAQDWMNYVAGFNFRVRHCPGLKHVLPHHLSHLYGILPGGEREKREEAFEVERKEREEEKRDEQAERARKKKERGSGEVSTEERVEVAEMTTRSRVREQVAEGSSKKREKRRQRRKNQKEKMKEGQTRVLNKEVSTEKGEEGREKKEEKGDEQEGEVGLCLQYNVGQKGFHVMRSRGVVYPMQTCHTDHLMGLEKVGPGQEFQDMLVVLDSAMRLVWLRAVKTTMTEETI